MGPSGCFWFFTFMNKLYGHSCMYLLMNINMYSFLSGILKIQIAGT